jgi:hypothetical protein
MTWPAFAASSPPKEFETLIGKQYELFLLENFIREPERNLPANSFKNILEKFRMERNR